MSLQFEINVLYELDFQISIRTVSVCGGNVQVIVKINVLNGGEALDLRK